MAWRTENGEQVWVEDAPDPYAVPGNDSPGWLYVGGEEGYRYAPEGSKAREEFNLAAQQAKMWSSIAGTNPEYIKLYLAAGGDPAKVARMEELGAWGNAADEDWAFGSEYRTNFDEYAALNNLFSSYAPSDHFSFGDFVGDMANQGLGMLTTLATNPVVMAAVTAGLATPAVAGGTAALTPIQAAATTGAVSGAAANPDDPLMGALRGGAIGGATAGAGQYAGDYAAGMFPDSEWLSGAVRGGAGALTGAALSGADNPWLAAGQGALMGGLSGIGPGTPSISDAEYKAFLAETDLNDMMVVGENAPSVQLGSDDVFVNPTTGQPMLRPMISPESLANTLSVIPESSLIGTQDIQTAMDTGNLIAPNTGENAPLPAVPTVPEGEETPVEEGAPTEEVPTEEPVPTEKELKLKDYVKMAKKVFDLMTKMGFGQDTPEFALPPREEGMTEEEYRALVSQNALDYLGLDADAMRAAGYEPGTQEYLDYILAQADKVIEAAFGDASVEELAGQSVEDLQAAFRGKSEEEMEQLTRALYARGALGTMSFRESAINPFTGELEYLGLESGEAAGGTAGAQRGYARFLEDTAGLTGPEARQAIRGMLGRDVDLFGLEKARKDKELDAMMNEFTASAPEDEEDEDEYERRGGRRGTSRRAAAAPSRGFWDQFRR